MKKTLLGVLVACLAITSCKKDLEQTASTNSGNKSPNMTALARQYEFRDWPSVDKGMLVFRDSNHISKYYDFLSEALTFDENSTDDGTINDPNEVLLEIENGLGFVSLRNTTQTKFDQKASIGWENATDIPDVHFINDLATRSLLSERADVQVGDKITRFISKDYAVTVEADRTDLVDAVRELSENAKLTEIMELDPRSTYITAHALSATDVRNGGMLKTTGYPFTINLGLATTPDPCLNPRKIRLSDVSLSVLGQAGITMCKAIYEISWGDGTTTTHTSTNGLNSAFLTVEHTYASNGNYTITFKARSISPVSTGATWDEIGVTQQVTVPNSCNYQYQKTSSTEWHYVNVGGKDYAWSGKTWVEQWLNMWSVQKTCHGARTEAYKKDGNSFKSWKADRVVAQYSIQKYASNCSTNWNGSGASWPNNSKTAEACHNNNGFWGWYSMWSNHQIKIGSNYYSFDRTMTPCN